MSSPGFTQLVPKDEVSDEEEGDSSDDSSTAHADRKGSDPCCPPFLNLRCCCHACYIFLFVTYLIMFPLWCKWLLTAPMPAMYWGQAFADFPRMPLEKTVIAQTEQDTPQILMSPVPDTDRSCNDTCGRELHGYASGEMNFDVTVRLNKPDLLGEVHTTYPVIMASQDFKEWILVADRRNAVPQAFFSDVDEDLGRKYLSVQDRCSKPDLTERGQYIVACVTWSSSKFADLRDAEDGVDGSEMSQYCDALGGVCGFVGSDMSGLSMKNCTYGGAIQQSALNAMMGGSPGAGTVEISACESAIGTCQESTEPFFDWPTHTCEVRAAARRLRRLQIGLPPGMDMPTGLGPSETGGVDTDTDSDEDAEPAERRYTSLPRMMVTYSNVTLPSGGAMLSHPKVYLLAATSLEGPFTKIYDPINPEADLLPPVPLGVPAPSEVLKVTEDESRKMTLESTNRLELHPTSCFGKRGPIYIVACAVNQSSYDDIGAWKNSKEQRFSMGQKVMPPPFNDRCVAVAGRCGYACEKHPVPLAHCNAEGQIPQDDLVGEIHIQYNRVTAVFMFAYVLIFGFAVKTIMLCPGIFSPYPRCPYYSSQLTEQLKYILVVGVTGGGDEGKGTMLRNTVGMVSGLPPNCKCHFVVCNNEEGHRLEMMHCWEKFCAVVSSIPQAGKYEDNLRLFMRVWCEETKSMRLAQVGGKVKQLDPSIQARLSGKTALTKINREFNWQQTFGREVDRLAAAIEVLFQDLGKDYNKFTPMTPHLDYVRDWTPPNTRSTALRMHFTSRAKPTEDPRNIMVQHVAVGTWYYKVAKDRSHPMEWLDLRKQCKEMVYSSLDEDMEGFVKVPLRSSHGKAGGLNFVDNYISIVYDHRPENRYPEDDDDDEESSQNHAPSLYAIADARHQFQPDFMISCLPCFFDTKGELNKRVAFTQAPQHYPEYADKYDYLDNNNAQFFRLNAMIRNCCGGVSSCGTNGMWQISGSRRKDTIWEDRKKRVRDRDSRKRYELIEREQFHTSCKIEDTASSLDRVLVGEYSHFVNRKLSFGMSKDPEGFLGAQQRWVEGAITLCLQWVTNNADAHGKAQRNQPLLWCVIIAFIGYVWSLIRLVNKQYTSSIFVEIGFLTDEHFETYIADPLKPGIHMMYNALLAFRGGHSPNSYSYEVYENMTLQFIVFLSTCIMAFIFLWIITNICKCFQRWWNLPNEMKWWGRLLISFDNLTYWVWFWTSFFWIGFNVYLATNAATFHFHNVGMMSFLLVATFLNYALIISNSLRFQVMESIDANEIAFLSMDNIWRANQLFFMVGPIQGFSVITGSKNFINYLFYGQDIGGWSGGDLTQVSIAIVKYWTTTIIIASACCWIYLFYSQPTVDEYQSRRPGCLIFSFIAMDVLHPCVYLWTVGNTLTHEEAKKMSLFSKVTSVKWWKKLLADTLLSEGVTNVFRYVAPVYNFMLPILVFYNAYFGVSAGFTLVAVGAGH